jgi:hypothetical protein
VRCTCSLAMAPSWRFALIAQFLLLVSLVEGLDINYCAPDNTGSGFQLGKGLCFARAESHPNNFCSSEPVPVQRSLSRHLQQQIRFRSHSRSKLLVLELCSRLQRQYVELQRSVPWVSHRVVWLILEWSLRILPTYSFPLWDICPIICTTTRTIFKYS